MEKVILTIFTDPMMGLSYECEPIFDRLKNEYGDGLEIRYVMAGLVRDVNDFMTPEELSYPPEEGILRYCKRLAGIYKSEEAIGGLPINMEGFHLFDENHRSSNPLCIAYEAAKLTDPEKADDFLKRLRYATVAETRQTTREDEILRAARIAGLDEEAFLRSFHDGSAEAAFQKDLRFTRSLGICSLPSYLLQYGARTMLIKALIGYDDFVRAIKECGIYHSHFDDIASFH